MTLSISDLFEESYYLFNNPDVAEAVRQGFFSSGFEHFIQFGQFELSSSPSRAPSPLYDERHYLTNNPDIAAAVQAGVFRSGFQHFIQFGQSELGQNPGSVEAPSSRSPSPIFNEAFYQANNTDVTSGVQGGQFSSGYEHFVRFGQFETDTVGTRDPSLLYNEQFYLAHNTDVANAVTSGFFESGFRHYILFGRREGRAAINTPPVANGDSFTANEDSVTITPILVANDGDRDGDALAIAGFTLPANGTLVDNRDGTFTYTPSPNFSGTDFFTYTVSDGFGGVASSTVTLTVNPVNDVPTAGNDTATGNEDTPLILSFANLLINDSDGDGDTLLVTGVGRQPTNGTITSNNGAFTYNPTARFFGTDSFTYLVSDGKGGTATATVNLTVNLVNLDPVANNDALTINEDTPGTVNPLANDSDPDGNPLTLVSFGQPSKGSVTNSNGTLTYTPNANTSGNDSFTYVVSDGRTGTATATVNITVNSIQDAPIAGDDAFTTNEDTPFPFRFTDLTRNDTDPDGDQIFLNGFTQPSRGSVVGNGDGTFTYNPGPNFNGTDSFTYRIQDSAGGSATATVRLIVNSINDVPVATNDAVSATEDTAFAISTANLLANDSDADGDPKIITGFSQAGNGRVVDNGNGFLTYTPSPNYSGTDSFSYTITDGKGGNTSATVNLTVAPVNDGPPVPVSDAFTTNEDTAVLISGAALLNNDSDPDPGDLLSITSVGLPSRGSLTNNNGTFTYTPNANVNGTDSFTYVVSDGNGGTALGVVNLTINSVNDGPPVANADSVTTDEDTASASFNVLANDTDTEGDLITLLSNTQPTNGSLTSTGDGTFVYTPRANFNGSDSFSYTISDGNGGVASTTVRIIVNSVQDPLVANNDAITTNEDAQLSFGSNLLTANDNDGDGDPFSINTFSQPTQGSLSRNGAGTFTYTPNANFNGSDSFTYTIRDNANGGTASATVNIVVNSTNDAPIAGNDAIAVNEDTQTLITIDPTLLGNDSDPDGDIPFITSFAQPGRGSLVDQGDGTYLYTPNTNISGTDSFTYTISDGRGGTANGVVNLTIGPVNDAPTARDDAYTVNEDTRLSITATNGVLRNDTDIDGDRLIVSVSDTNSAQGGTVVVNNNGSFTYQAPTDFSGTDSFTYTVADPSGAISSATVIMTVNPINDRPTATPDAVTTNEEEAITIDLTDNASDVDGDVLTFATATNPRNGAVTNNGDGTFNYTPNVNFSGSDSFAYTVNDGRGGTATSTVSITVANVNDIPVGRNDSFTTTEDPGSVTIPNVLANDTDVDRDPLSVSSNTDPTNGTVVNNGNGTFSYTPTTNFSGTDSFTYVVDDLKGGTAEATVLLTVTPVNDRPVATNEDVSTGEETAIAINLLDNASDVDGDSLAFSVGTNPRNGSVVNNNNGVFTYTPRLNFFGSDSFTYRVNDGRGGTALATVNITVEDVNDAPVARNDRFTGNEDTAFTFNVIANDTDLERDPLNVAEFTEVANGTLTPNADGTFTYQANENFNGSDSFTYVIDDGRGGTATATVNLTIRPGNDAPTAISDDLVTNEDTLGTINVLANDSDVDNDTFGVLTFTQAGRGTVRNLGNGNFSYQPLTNFNGSDSFTYTIRDSRGATATSTVNVTVDSVNDAPIARNDTLTINEDAAATPINILVNDTDADGDALTVINFTETTKGTLLVDNGTFSYQPNPNANGSDSFTYVIDDGQGGSASATVNIVIRSLNDAPLAVNDELTLDEDTLGRINVIANDTDADSTFSVLSFTQAGRGTVRNLGNGNFSYQPLTNFNGSDSFTYTVRDAAGATATATVSVGVNSINDAPIARNDSQTINEDNAAILINVIANDTDVDRDPLTIVSFTDATRGTLTDNANGTFTYQPSPNANGSDSFTYIVDDGQGGSASATVNIVIRSLNDAPLAVNDSLTLDEDTTGSINVIANDTDADSTFSVLSFTQAGRGTVRNLGNGNFSYQPLTNFNGSDSFTYTVRDAAGATATATVSVGVNSINDAPIARNDSQTINEDNAAILINVIANDTDVDRDPLTIVSFTDATRGTLTDNANGTFTYQPSPNANGSDSFTYIVDDGQGGSASATVNIVIRSLNDAPLAVNDSLTLDEDTTGSINVIANDTDADSTFSVLSFTQAGRGTVRNLGNGNFSYQPLTNFNGSDSFTYTVRDAAGATATATVSVGVNSINDAPIARNDTLSLNEDAAATPINILANDTDADGDTLTVISFTETTKGALTFNNGAFSYQPSPNANGSDSFTYVVDDGNGGSASATVTINIASVNDLPVAVNDVLTVNEDASGTINVITNDTDADGDPITLFNFGPASRGVVRNNNGTITYTPNPNANGTDSFTYSITDGRGGTSTGTVNVTINPVNDAPLAGNDSVTTNEDTPATFNVFTNDTDADGDSLIVINFTDPGKGSITSAGNGSFTYTPNANANGSDSFTYVVNDANGGTAAATVNITISPVNDLPIAVNDAVTTNEDAAVTVNVLANDTDVDGDFLTIAGSTQGSNGAVTDNGDGTFNYNPNPNFSGTDSFTYTVSDGRGGSATATVNVAIAPVNDLPITSTDYFVVGEGASRTLSDTNLLANDFDDDDLQSSLRIVGLASSPVNGTITRGNGGFNYTPRSGFNGNDSFSYIVRDPQGGTATGTVNLVVARNLDSPFIFSKSSDNNIENSTTIPHATVSATGDGTFDYYSFTAGGPTAILDIDFGVKATGSIDTQLFLFDQTGALVVQNDNASTSNGGLGSASGADAYIKATNLTANQVYIVGVSQSGAGFSGGQLFGNPPNPGQTYTLQVSVEGHPFV
ncbi:MULTISPECIES: tandem-95 repeat protein [Trichocoleus]|uniref:Tandem-95 repeat protein n=1 Tax=Trichocoleus desertorum GB2-A4 TaxID=2933944 RepID=A0ABV0J8A1_9CYAN|nr:tandem-95 repeat protein [Trichocoleus sp. FACHB-46]MBD1863356.1 tandem-95 repeat protein [Trichocoleus sp. FACHB-46]